MESLKGKAEVKPYSGVCDGVVIVIWLWVVCIGEEYRVSLKGRILLILRGVGLIFPLWHGKAKRGELKALLLKGAMRTSL